MNLSDRSTAIGKSINAYLKGEQQIEDHVIHLLFSANRWEAAEQMRTDIASGITLIVDRYFCSGVVYSAAKQNPSLGVGWAYQPEIGLPRPDACFFLDISPADAAKRGGFGDERYEESSLQQRARALFPRILKTACSGYFEIIDGGQSLEDVEERILSLSIRDEALGLSKPLASLGPLLFLPD